MGNPWLGHVTTPGVAIDTVISKAFWTKVTEGVVAYVPPVKIVTDVTLSPSNSAVARAVTVSPASKRTYGALVYPLPPLPFAIVTDAALDR